MKNPVIGTAPCDHVGCQETMTVHEVKRGGSSHRGQIYTRCPECGCDQTSGKRRQQLIIETTTPRPEYAELFEFKAKVDDSAVSDDIKPEITKPEEPQKPDVAEVSEDSENQKIPKAVIGVFGLLVVGGLAILGIKK